MLAFIFPGQGSQQRGMGRALFDSVKAFAAIESQVNEMLGYSLRELCLNGTADQLRQTQYTQPSLYAVNALHYYQALAAGQQPDIVAGHSLGEYNALLAAGAFDFLTGLRLVQKRGELMAAARGGAMAAVIGINAQVIATIIREHRLSGLEIANYNSGTQTVVSGSAAEMARAATMFEAAGAQQVVPLPVSGAFHTRFMNEAAAEFADFLQEQTFREPRIPVVANVTGRPYPAGHPSQAIRSFLVKQMTCSVHWQQSIDHMICKGVTAFTEVGPGSVLTRLLEDMRGTRAHARMEAPAQRTPTRISISPEGR